MDDNTTTSEMNQQIASLEAELGAPIDPMPLSPSDIHSRWGRLREDSYGHPVLEVADNALGPWALWVGGAIAVLGLVVMLKWFPSGEGPSATGHIGITAMGLVIALIGICLVFASRFGRATRIRFCFDSAYRVVEHTQPMRTGTEVELGSSLPFDRIAAIQLCGTTVLPAKQLTLNRYTHGAYGGSTPIISQLNLVLTDPPASRVRLVEFSMDLNRMTGIAKYLSEITGAPLIVHERIDWGTSDFGLPEPPPPLGPDGLEQTKTRITVEKRHKVKDYLTAFDDKLYPDEDDDG